MTEASESEMLSRSELPTLREGLSDEQLGNLISAMGNSEAKAATILTMKYVRPPNPPYIYTPKMLYDDIMTIQGESPGWRMDSQLPVSYVESSLAPIGLVAREVIDKDVKTYGWIKTPFLLPSFKR